MRRQKSQRARHFLPASQSILNQRTRTSLAMAKKEKPPKKGADKKKEAEAAAPEEGAEGAEGAEGEGKKKKLSGKALILFIVLPAVLVLSAGGAAAFFLLGAPQAEQHAAEDGHGKEKAKAKGKDGHGGEEEGAPGPHGVVVTEGDGVVFAALPEMLVNITTADGRPAYLKLRLTLEAPDHEAIAALEPQVPRITDQFTGFLRELRTDDLSGSAGAYRLRLELLRRVNLVIAPARINAVLIEEMLVQ